MSSMTIIRLLELQAWPTFSIRVTQAVLAASSTSSVSRMMYGSEPPSSRTTFFRLRPAVSATAVPARSEPVNDTPRSRGSAIIAATCSWVANRLTYTPSGTPASFMICAIAPAEVGGALGEQLGDSLHDRGALGDRAQPPGRERLGRGGERLRYLRVRGEGKSLGHLAGRRVGYLIGRGLRHCLLPVSR